MGEKIRLYMLRHGRQNSALCNVNVPLSEEGIRQAELAVLKRLTLGSLQVSRILLLGRDSGIFLKKGRNILRIFHFPGEKMERQFLTG